MAHLLRRAALACGPKPILRRVSTTWRSASHPPESASVSNKGEFIHMRTPFRRTAIAACVMFGSLATVLVAGTGAVAGAPSRQAADVDWTAVQTALGRPGTMMPGD